MSENKEARNRRGHLIFDWYYDEWADEKRCGTCGRRRDENGECV
jgi:hypothetical protein